ncbi:MAG: hypothetical protein EOL87_10670 [Spartobacteria bacterium]|nr:hypothetical protein [Spartobacteria bacterium]
MNQLLEFVAEKFYYVFLFCILFTFIVRVKGPYSIKKRRTYFIISIAFFFVYTSAICVMPPEGFLPIWAFPVIVTLAIAAAVYLIAKAFPFTLHCVSCRKRLDSMTFFLDDRNQCANCRRMENGEQNTDVENEKDIKELPDE